MPAKGKSPISKERKAELVAMLPAFNGCAAALAQSVQVSDSVISRAKQDPEITRMANEKKPQLADLFEDYATKGINVLLGKIEQLTPRDFTSLGIAVDKMLLLRGQPTSITETRDNSDAVLAEVSTLFDLRRQSLALAGAPQPTQTELLAWLRERAPTLAAQIVPGDIVVEGELMPADEPKTTAVTAQE